MAVAYILSSLCLGLLTAVLYTVVRWMKQFRRTYKLMEKFPGPPLKWPQGNLHQHPLPSGESVRWRLDQLEKYGSLVRLWFGPTRPMIQVNSPAMLRHFVQANCPKNLTGPGYRFFYPWLGDGLLVSQGAKWHRNRKLLTPAFHFEILKPYVDIYNVALNKLLKKFEAASEGQKSFEIFGAVSLSTLDVMMRCAFSYEQDIQEAGDKHPYVMAIKELSYLFVDRFFTFWKWVDFIYYRTANGKRFLELSDYTHSISEKVIKERRTNIKAQNQEEPKKKLLDFLDILITAKDANGEGLTDVEIRDEVETFMFEGHDTTASALSWTLYSLAQNPEAQNKARQEVDMVLGDDPDKYVTWDDLSQLKYVNLCIKEGMRLHTTVPYIGRRVVEDMVIDGRVIPAGAIVDFNLYNIHHNADVWGNDHMDYKPERFEADNMLNKDSFAFVPFSAGSRNCIGQNFAMQEMKVTIARVLHKYELSVDEDHAVDYKPELIMRSKDGIKLFIKSRAITQTEE